jgi:hypothetical protein
MKRFSVIVFVLVLSSAAVSALYVGYWKRKLRIPAFGGSNINVQLPDNVHYMQNDLRWSQRRLGNPNANTLKAAGCTVASVAMAMSNLGFETDPGKLANALTAEEGFTFNLNPAVSCRRTF